MPVARSEDNVVHAEWCRSLYLEFLRVGFMHDDAMALVQCHIDNQYEDRR